jgi:hypothetical protein
MKRLFNFPTGLLMGVVFGAALLSGFATELLFEPQACAQQAPAPKPGEVAGASMDLQKIYDRLPDQSHAMQDAGYHFQNLWFAGGRQNWPLASYYLRKTRSYLKLAVLIKPVRKTQAGDVNLQGILDAVDHSLLAQLDQAITNKDVDGFKTAYRQTIEGCNGCHSACERSYIHLQVPTMPSALIIDFDPPSPGANKTD